MKPIGPMPEPLTTEQLRVAQLFAAMDDRRQQEAIAKMERMAARHPRRAAPVLRIVKGCVQ